MTITKTMVATGKMRYRTRMLLAGDEFEAKPRDAKVFIAAKLAKIAARRDAVTLDAPPMMLTNKIARTNRVKREVDPIEEPAAEITEPVTAPEPEPEAAVDDLATLRAEYQSAVGRRPFNGWDAETLREKIAEAGDDE